MSVTQTSPIDIGVPINIGVEIPASHRANGVGEVIDVPREVPMGPVVLTFTPAPSQKPDVADDDGLDYAGECPICAAHRDPVTGEERFNAETVAAIREGRAMMRGEIPAKRFKTVAEMFEDLDRDDPDDMDD